MTLSGGMKRRVLIAKALSHEPRILFLDEPTAGVDVELRREMWKTVQALREDGVTIIPRRTTSKKAEQMADRIGVINKGELVLVEKKHTLMEKLGKRQLVLHLVVPLDGVPSELAEYGLELSSDKKTLVFQLPRRRRAWADRTAPQRPRRARIAFKDLATKESSLEDIFVDLVGSTTSTEGK